MKYFLPALVLTLCTTVNAYAQSVFNPADPILRYDSTKPKGSALNPDPSVRGLQKWVSTPTKGVTAGSSTIDVSSFKQYFINLNGAPMAFRIKFPKSYSNPDSAAKKYPVMLFLHGAGEVGCPTNGGVYNNEKQLWIGGGLFRDFVDQNLFDGFLLYPQLVNNEGCWGAWGSASANNYLAIIGMIDSMARYIRADADRLVVNGLSGGGYGAWRMAATYPQRVAKIIPSAAAGSTSSRTEFVHIPIWFATGAKDPDPSPAQAEYSYNRMKDIGADIRYTQYADLGHSVWYRHWREQDYAAQMNDQHKANPLVFFQHDAFCEGESVNAKLGITAGFYAYEWQRDGVNIATRTNGVNTILLSQHVISFTGNEITVKSFGQYRVRFKRTAASEWSDYSRKPAEIKLKGVTVTPPITVQGLRSKVLPALDGSTTVPLQLTSGFDRYEWVTADEQPVSSSAVFQAPVGEYKARYYEKFGCGTTFSPLFKVVNAEGTPKPDAPTKLIAAPAGQTSITLSWTQGNNETGFEVYRGATAGGPYQFAGLTPANVVLFTDTGLQPNSNFYYLLRAVNETGASAASNEATAKTLNDVSFPSAPIQLTYRGSNEQAVWLSWLPAVDNGSIKRYDIYANGTKLYSTTKTSFKVVNLEKNKSYTFVVKAIDNSNNPSASSNQVTANTHTPGWNYRYYPTTASWSVLPNFNTLTPAKTGTADSLNVQDPAIHSAITRFGMVWEAYLYVPVSGNYTLETRSDDGSKVYIDKPYGHTTAATVSNDGIHGMKSAYGTLYLTQGYHSIAVSYFQRVYGFGLELYWKNDVGLARERIPGNFFTAQPVAAQSTLLVPAAPSATAVSHTQIRIGWTDNNASEAGYEIVRSTAATGTYVNVGTTAANATSLTDSGLTHSKTYYYRVRAIGAPGESGYTATVSALTQAAPKLVPAPTPLVGFGGANNSISLNWQDKAINEWNYRVYRSTNGTKYTVLASLKPNVNGYTDVTTVAQTTYYYYVVGYNGSGLGPQTNIVKIKAGNNAPAFQNVSGIVVKAGATAIQSFSATDDAGDEVTVSILQSPAFATIEKTGTNNFKLTVSPDNNAVGQYQLTLQATDVHGATATTLVDVLVNDESSRSVFINLGSEGKDAAAPWNNLTGNGPNGTTTGGLKDESGNNVPFSLTLSDPWNGFTLLGHRTGNNGGIAPDAVLESGLSHTGSARQMHIGGLDAFKRYNIRFISSQNEGLPGIVQFTTGSQTAVADARYNTHQSASLNGLSPDAGGQIAVTVSRASGSPAAFLNGLVIEEIDPSITLMRPDRLYGEPMGRNAALLTWNDRTNNENSTTGYELQRAGDSLFTQNLHAEFFPANTTRFTDGSLQPDRAYWYRVRAVDGEDRSQFSNFFRVITPASIVSINFNTTLPDEASPWNNTASTPLNEFVTEDLVDHTGTATGMSLSVVKVFNGEFTAGYQSGNNSGIVPDNVLAANFWLDNTQISQVKISGLNHTKRYRFGFVGSSASPGWFRGDYTATYSINGKTVYLNSWMNSTKIVYLSDVIPDEAGEVLVTFSTTQGALYGFNAGMTVQEYTDHQGGSMLYISNSSLEPEAAPSVVASNLSLKVYPNPSAGFFTVELNNSRTGRIGTELYDMHGRLLHRQPDEVRQAGRQLITITPPGSVPNGLMIVVIKMEGRVAGTIRVIRQQR